jgi:hypothetical protein
MLLKTNIEKMSTFCLATMFMKTNDLNLFCHDVYENKGGYRRGYHLRLYPAPALCAVRSCPHPVPNPTITAHRVGGRLAVPLRRRAISSPGSGKPYKRLLKAQLSISVVALEVLIGP